jgi:small-conductance mechanosensitive channel
VLIVEVARELFDSATGNPYVRATAIVLVSLVAMLIVDFIVSRVFRVVARQTSTPIDDVFVELSHRPIRTSVLLVGLSIATHQLDLPERYVSIIMSVLMTIAVLVWMVFAMRFVSLLLVHAGRSKKVSLVETRTQPLFDNLAKIVFIAAAIYFILVFWNINVSAWLASAGIIGIAVGFAAKDTLANLFSGIFILADAPYKIGDYVNLDSGERGEVTHVGLRSTRLLTRDDVEITVPNSVIANAKIINETGGPSERERLRIKVGVAYGTDVDRLREILMEIATSHPLTCEDPEPRVRFRNFGDSSLDFELLCWIEEPVLRGRVIDTLNTQIYKRLAVEGIEIPYPKRDVYIRQMPSPKSD